MSRKRVERDSMGPMELPEEALYGASTQRAVDNFPISGIRFGRSFIRALALIKWAAAEANLELDLLTEDQANYLVKAAEEVISGKWDGEFPLDIFQTGSGTSTNMNMNEVLANRAAQLAGKAVGSREVLHPNDHVNLGQSSNDVIPTAIHVAVAEQIKEILIPALDGLHNLLERKTMEFWEVLKVGRTHLMDATPIRLGQEFSGYARQVELARTRCERAIQCLEELPLGGTAVGTGLNAHPEFVSHVLVHLRNRTGIHFKEAKNHFEAQAGKDALVEVSGILKTVAVSLFKMANDIRWMGSGPRCGFGELSLPPTQPGSSIMPGKVNPVMSEMMMQVSAKVIGNDASITWAGANGNFELNTMMPLMAHDLLESVRLLANATTIFSARCVEGLRANRDRCEELIEKSLAMVTSLVPLIGYDKAAEIAKESEATGKTVRQIAQEWEILPKEVLKKALDPLKMTER